MKQGVLNLLKVVDLPPEDEAQLVKMGFGDLLHKAGKDQNQAPIVNMQLEADDDLKANVITFKFIAFKTSGKLDLINVPRRLQILMRFFSFPEIQTDTVSLRLPGTSADLYELLPGQTYYLGKDRYVEEVGGRVQKEKSSTLND